MDCQIIKATADDARRISEIENIAFSDPWSVNMILSSLESELTEAYMAVSSRGEVFGYAFLSVVLDEAELENIAVHPFHRRKGIAGALLGFVAERARDRGAEVMYLEVRESNEAARTLYSGVGFEEIAFRANYYCNPTEDAIIMRKYLSDDKVSEERQ